MDSAFDLLEKELKKHFPPNPAAQQSLSMIEAHVRVMDRLLADRQKILEAIPECSVHGLCVPHALEWIEKAAQAMNSKADNQKQNNDSSIAADKGILMDGLSLAYDSAEERRRLSLYGNHRLSIIALKYADTLPEHQAGDLFYVMGKRLAA